MSEIIEVKVGNPQNSTNKNWVNFLPTLKCGLFSGLGFQKEKIIPMGKEVQSDKLPIFDSQKSTKTTIKLLKISQFKAFKFDQAFCNTL